MKTDMSIHNCGTKKECLILKRLQKTILDLKK